MSLLTNFVFISQQNNSLRANKNYTVNGRTFSFIKYLTFKNFAN